ncbi:MAG: NHL repeat-containing protein [Chthoniobacterales bacterium]
MIAARRLLTRLALVLLAGLLPARAQSIPDYPVANLVLGQLLFTTNSASVPPNAASLATPYGISVDPVSGKVFVADTGNNRVLRYASAASLVNGATPEIVIGQVNFSSYTANQGNVLTPSQTSLSAPADVFVDATGRLWVADTNNNRVLLFENASNLFNTPFADRVYGQPDFGTATAAATQSKLASPNGVCVDPAGTLWVADTGSHRVMAWKIAAAIPNGMPADRVLGQATFTTAVAATSQTGLFSPRGIAADDAHVWVADSGSNRVVMYANFPAINGAPANLVLGQATYIASTPATSATGMTSPTSVALFDGILYVADSGNNRVVSFADAEDLSNGGDATGIIGQATFTTGSSGLSSQKIALFNSHVGVDLDGNLFVADTLNNRALRFIASVLPPVPPDPIIAPSVKINGQKQITTTKKTFTLRGTAEGNPGIARVSYNQNGVGYVYAKGTLNWHAKIRLEPGRNKIVVKAVALDGTVSPPKSVSITKK